MLLKAVTEALDALVPPFATGSTPVTPEVRTRPVQFVSTPDVGVPRSGVTRVGEVESTTATVPVETATPVPPWATGRGAVSVIDPRAVAPFTVKLLLTVKLVFATKAPVK